MKIWHREINKKNHAAATCSEGHKTPYTQHISISDAKGGKRQVGDIGQERKKERKTKGNEQYIFFRVYPSRWIKRPL